MNGVIVVDKPKGPTSFDVVHAVRRALKIKKVGHTGTLDPMATGVLPICIGDGTKIAQYIIESSKAYDAVLKLGIETDTLDAEGKVVAERPVPALTTELIEAALQKFRGTFSQIPPMYSAVKIDGKRLYELAREGKEVERKPREVTVTSLVLRDFSATEIRLSVACTKGFFVRTLAQDIGHALGCGAHLTALRRTHTGRFSLAQAVTLEAILMGQLQPGNVVSMTEALGDLAAIRLDAAAAEKVLHGGAVEVAHPEELVRVMGPADELLAIAQVERGRLKYRRVLAQATDE